MMQNRTSYKVQCPTCGHPVEVLNPRLHEEPLRIWQTDFGLCLSERIEIARTHCQGCGRQVWAKFQYDTKQEKPWISFLRKLGE